MAVPFHRLRVCGDVLLAARGASVHAFRIADGAHLSVWSAGGKGEQEKKSEKEDDQPSAADVPPAKRRRVDEAAATDAPARQSSPSAAGGGNKAAKAGKAGKSKPPNAALRSADLPVVSILEAAADGRHAVVVMGHDKTVRVLAHEGGGQLTELSARVMPKRPSAVAFTADGQTLLVGDKFGDVYALPLVAPEKQAAAAAPSGAALSVAVPPPVVVPSDAPLRLEANQFTVHTKGNRQALENQRRQKELLLQQKQKQKQQQQDADADADEKDGGGGQYQLLLGHVSMLTAVAVAEGVLADDDDKAGAAADARSPRRPLILTADRDEHIRVTRGVVTGRPAQTHVIETFCLGHTSFVSRLCTPRRRPGRAPRLVSGGGDGSLRVWDFWPTGRQVGQADLAAAVAATAPASASTTTTTTAAAAADAPKVALSGLYALDNAAADADADTLVAICERVPALFFFRLEADGSTLAHSQTLRLPGGQLPLDVAEVAAGAGAGGSGGCRLVVAVVEDNDDVADGTAASAAADPLLLTVVEEEDQGGQRVWSVATASATAAFQLPATAGATAAALDGAALRRLLLYSNESLRKDSEGEE